jgi:peptidoglycan-associated lipoprotein
MRMRNPLLTVFVASYALAACHGKTPPPKAPAPPVAPSPPPPAPPPPAARAAAPQLDEYSRIKALDIDSINRLGLLQDIHFDFDKADMRDGDRTVLTRNAEQLRKFDFLSVSMEGHCDERGTVEYNLALGERRARAARDYLVSLGVPAERLKTVSYGKENPLCQDHSEDCWSRNRRGHLTVTGKAASR